MSRPALPPISKSCFAPCMVLYPFTTHHHVKAGTAADQQILLRPVHGFVSLHHPPPCQGRHCRRSANPASPRAWFCIPSPPTTMSRPALPPISKSCFAPCMVLYP